jgi:hypothetical protein
MSIKSNLTLFIVLALNGSIFSSQSFADVEKVEQSGSGSGSDPNAGQNIVSDGCTNNCLNCQRLPVNTILGNSSSSSSSGFVKHCDVCFSYTPQISSDGLVLECAGLPLKNCAITTINYKL